MLDIGHYGGYYPECMVCGYKPNYYESQEEVLKALDRREGIIMVENKTDDINRIKDITLEIAFHENRIAMHKSAIRRLKKEKSILMMNGERANK